MRPLDTIDAALEDLRQGKMIVVVDDEDRENEGDFVMAAEMVTPEAVNFMATHGRGMICAPLTMELARRFHLPLQAQQSTAPLGTAFTLTIDAARHVTTGISAADRSHTLKLLTQSETTAHDFTRPGHIFPLIARDGGVLERPGHTEASVDLARLAGLAPVGVICEIMNADGSMSRRADLDMLAAQHGLKVISIADLIQWRKRHENLIDQVESVPLTTTHGDFTLFAFHSDLLQGEHLAVVKGDPAKLQTGSPLLRVHSECFTGDVLGSRRCDCGSQLHRALERINAEGSGLVIYLRHHEGRGIGLMNKVRAYQLQDQGQDTVEANLSLGLPADARDYAIAAQILKHFKIKNARLLTNNPLKLKALHDLGADALAREAHETNVHEGNAFYLATKKAKLGHWLNTDALNS